MKEKLTYKEWRVRHIVNISPEVKEDLKKFHNIDAVDEIEKAMRKEYEYYLNREFNK